jgi:hypothetical protein
VKINNLIEDCLNLLMASGSQHSADEVENDNKTYYINIAELLFGVKNKVIAPSAENGGPVRSSRSKKMPLTQLNRPGADSRTCRAGMFSII